MNLDYLKIQKLLQQRAELTAKLNIIPYEGSLEIKKRGNNKYLYLRKRVLGKYTSTYIDVYSDDLFVSISNILKEAREYKKQLRKINISLAKLGHVEQGLSPRVLLNVDFARANMKINIHNQSILEGIATTFTETETILDNGIVYGMKASDIQKILNLKHAWEFIIDKDVIASKTSYSILCNIARLINENFYTFGGSIRSVPVKIGGTTYLPPIPIESTVQENIKEILSRKDPAIDIAIDLCLYCMKTQIFIDGNKRSSVIFANHFLISKGEGLLVIPEHKVADFKKVLVSYYEDNDIKIKEFLKKHCWKTF